MDNQSDFVIDFSKHFKNSQYVLEGEIGYQNYPDDYYDYEFDAEYIPVELTALYQFNEHIYTGPMYHFKYSHIDFDDNNFASNLIGAGYVHYSAVGWKFLYKDMPKGNIYHRQGFSFDLTGMHYSPVLGSSEEFSKIGMDFRHYYPFFEKSVLAFQITAKSAFGHIPFNYQFDLENKGILRGGSERLGKYFIASQLEYRFPVFWRINAAVFAGLGNAANDLDNMTKKISFAGGIGPRIILNKKKNITVRFDFAINNDAEKGIYIRIKEAF